MSNHRRRVKGQTSRTNDPHLVVRSIQLGHKEDEILRFDVPRVMGILNVTPDSFSGDGIAENVELAVSRGMTMFRAGADLVDVGGESTRPGAESVDVDVEIKRTVPVVSRLSGEWGLVVSIDTMKPEVATRALEAGATIVNDVSGLRDPRMIATVSNHDSAVIIMHMKGDPRTMQEKPTYKDVVSDILEFLADRIDAAERAGVSQRKIMVDPGIGFGKSVEHNLEILSRLKEFKVLGKPIVVGISRKSFLGKLTGSPAQERLEESIAAAVLAVKEGADILRVHDVPETVKALKVAGAIINRSGSPP